MLTIRFSGFHFLANVACVRVCVCVCCVCISAHMNVCIYIDEDVCAGGVCTGKGIHPVILAHPEMRPVIAMAL